MKRVTDDMETVEGQITFRRALSKRLVFFDLQRTQSAIEGDAKDIWVEVVVKQGVYGNEEDVRALRDTLHLGDIVLVQGYREQQQQHGGSAALQARCVTLRKAWRDAACSVAFVPRPAPRGCAAAAADVACEPQQLPQVAERTIEGAVLGAVEAATHPPAPPLCKFFANSMRCAKGDACPYAHTVSTGGRQAWVQERMEQRTRTAAALGLAHSAAAAAKGQRAILLAEWLLQTYGRQALSAGAGVLDVAGGAGGLTWQLSAVHGVRCTLIDPRPFKLTKQQRRQLARQGRGAELACWTAEQLVRGENLAPAMERLALAPASDRAWRFGGTGSAGSAGSAGSGGDQQLRQLAVTALQCSESGCNQLLPAAAGVPLQLQQVQGCFEPALWRSTGWRELLGGASLVLGLHPDQATEAILEHALEAQLPFAIVPCCVFQRLFPHRVLHCADGSTTTVGSHADLVQYLAQRGGASTATARLGFEGADTVVYRVCPRTGRTA